MANATTNIRFSSLQLFSHMRPLTTVAGQLCVGAADDCSTGRMAKRLRACIGTSSLNCV